MQWLAFSYSLSSKGRSSPRVALWRRLQRLGAISVTGSVYILPDRPECLEGFQWLMQEVQQAGGEALVMRVERFEGRQDAELVEHFHAARRGEYEALDAEISALWKCLPDGASAEAHRHALETLEKLRKRYVDMARLDFFGSPEGATVAARLTELGQALTSGRTPDAEVASVDPRAFRRRTWVTRPRPHVDRLASAWLIRCFIDPEALIRYGDRVEDGEVSFDMPGARFGHVGDRCTFETMIQAFNLSDPGLQAVAELVHELDLRDARYARPELVGLDAILEGWRRLEWTDQELEAHGVALFEGLYLHLKGQHEGLLPDR